MGSLYGPFSSIKYKEARFYARSFAIFPGLLLRALSPIYLLFPSYLAPFSSRHPYTMEDCVANSIPCDKSAILSRIFSKTTWKEEMASLGFTALFIGVDLERFEESGLISDGTTSTGNNTPAYLALGLAIKESRHPLAKYPDGFPERALFFDCLKPWKWVNEKRHDLLIEESNIELNISEYYRRKSETTLLASPADATRLAKERPNAATEKCINRKHITYVISYSDEDPGQIGLWYYQQDFLCVVVQLWGGYRVWQFIGTGS